MLDQWRYQKRIEHAGGDLFQQFCRKQTVLDWSVLPVPGAVKVTLNEWPIEAFDGAQYKLVSTTDAADAVEALAWWFIAMVEIVRGRRGADAATAADTVLSLRARPRDIISADEGPVSVDEVASALTHILIGRAPEFEEEFRQTGVSLIIVSSFRWVVDQAGVVAPVPRVHANGGAGASEHQRTYHRRPPDTVP